MRVMMISPSVAYWTMFWATSEMAVAMIERSLLENPPRDASSRPCCRAAMISAEHWIRTRASLSLLAMAALNPPVHMCKVLLQNEDCGHRLRVHLQLDHRHHDIERRSNDDSFGPA